MEKQLKRAEFKVYQQKFYEAIRYDNPYLAKQVLDKYPSLINDDIKPINYACKWNSHSVLLMLITTKRKYMDWLQLHMEPLCGVESGKFNKLIDTYLIDNNWKSCLENAMLKSIYYAHPDCLEKILELASMYKIKLKFEPHSQYLNHTQTHLDWILTNIKHGEQGARVGWSCGPDSGPGQAQIQGIM